MERKNVYVVFLIDFIFCRLAETAVSHVTFSEVASVWGVGAVAILGCSLKDKSKVRGDF